MRTEAVFEPGFDDLKVPGAALVEGLPGVGLVAKVAVAYLLDKLGGKRVCRFYSPYFPSLGYVRNGRLLPYFADLYLVEKPKPLLLLYGNAQPATYYGQYEFCEKVLDVGLSLGANLIITLGGYGKEHVGEKRTIYLSSTREDIIKKLLSKLDATPYEGQIIGAAGLLITMAGERGVENFSLLVEAGEATPDYQAAKRGAEALAKLLDLDLVVGDVYELSKSYEKIVRMIEEW
ncbi:MAG: hypothetical protein DRN64_01995 [Thaumarchaeota archaeon]|nr:MAG: hypothetical protein DRN64_01995 [Nitrososphaerota archaeon]